MKANEGDSLTVSWPEVMVPVAHMTNVKVGGLMYTRKLKEGDDVSAVFDEVYAFLDKKARATAQTKMRAVIADIETAKQRKVG